MSHDLPIPDASLFENNHPCTCGDPGRVHTLYAYVGEDASGEEGILSMATQIGIVALVGADRERMNSPAYRQWAQARANALGKPVYLRRYELDHNTVETLEPQEPEQRPSGLWVPQ